MMAREEAVSEVPYYVIKTRAREIYYTKADLALAMEGAKGVVKRRATPASCVFEWPLVVGKEWEEKYVWENLAERTTKDRHRHYKVEAVDTVTVPAGTFQTFHVMVKESTGKLVGEYWYSPEAKWFVKDRTYHSYGVREQELLEYKVR